MSACPAPRVLTYHELQMVRVYVFLAKRGAQGGTRRDIAGHLGRSHTSPRLRTLLDAMRQRGFITARRAVWDRRQPWVYHVDQRAWQKG